MRTMISILSVVIIATTCTLAQDNKEISRIEFNSGTRSYREQIIITPDSIIVVKEDFTKDKKPNVKTRTNTAKQWASIVQSFADIRLSEIETLESPSMKRAYDGASHGSLIITARDSKTYTHGFDDMDPHEKFKPLMEHIKRLRK